MIIVGVDPGTGVSSPTGLVMFDPVTLEILHVSELTSKFEDDAMKIKDIAEQLEFELTGLDPDEDVHVFIESFVMQGKSGEKLARLTGALMSHVPYQFKVGFVHNTTVKKQVTGAGNANKPKVAEGVLEHFKTNKASSLIIANLILEERWDPVDAAAIGLAGSMLRGLL